MAKAQIKIEGKAPAKRNGIAASLAQAAFRPRAVKAKKGRGSYSRKAKHASAAW